MNNLKISAIETLNPISLTVNDKFKLISHKPVKITVKLRLSAVAVCVLGCFLV
jgi:hypothetical protein